MNCRFRKWGFLIDAAMCSAEGKMGPGGRLRKFDACLPGPSSLFIKQKLPLQKIIY